MQAYLYAILVDDQVRYVGKGRRNRINEHLRVAAKIGVDPKVKPSFAQEKIAEAIKGGSRVIAKKLIVNLSDDEAFALEKRAIEIVGLENLWNVIEGGVRGFTSEHAKATWDRPGYREKMAKITASRWADPDMREKMLAPHREAMRQADKQQMAALRRELWKRPEYAEKQRAARSEREYKDRVSASVKICRTEEANISYGLAVSQSWSDPEKRKSRLDKKAARDAERFPETIQAKVLKCIENRAEGISTAEIKQMFPNARGAIEKLTQKGLIEKRGGKYGLFFLRKD